MVDIDNPFDKGGILDSRDVITYLSELESHLESLKEDLANWENDGGPRPEVDPSGIAELGQHYNDLQEFCEECSGYSSDWTYGETLIPEDEFTDYVKQLVEDIGDLPRELPAYIVIDWDATADNLKVDYTEVEFEGTTYFIRSC